LVFGSLSPFGSSFPNTDNSICYEISSRIEKKGAKDQLFATLQYREHVCENCEKVTYKKFDGEG
jgi:hypothetical protein